jgi:hypothetical protein
MRLIPDGDSLTDTDPCEYCSHDDCKECNFYYNIEISNTEWDEIGEKYQLHCIHMDYKAKPFSQYLHELIKLKQDMENESIQ